MIKEILSAIEGLKTWFSAEVLKVRDAESKAIAATSELATANASIVEKDKKISDLAAAVSKHDETVKAKDATISDLQAKLTEAQNKAMEVINGQGLPADKLPEGGSGETKSTQQQIDAIRDQIAKSTDPKEKSTLSRKIKALLTTSKN